jgi:hypothetical protein
MKALRYITLYELMAFTCLNGVLFRPFILASAFVG